jgi:hypothetical protein
MSDFRRYAAVVAVFATVLYLALLIAVFGQISLYTNLEVIPEADAGFVVGPVMSGIATLIVLFALLSIGLRIPVEKQRVSVPGALGIGIAAYLGYTLLGGAIYAAGRGDPFGFILFVGRSFLSPFPAAVGLLAFLVTLAYMLVLASRVGEKGAPKWPWERPKRPQR